MCLDTAGGIYWTNWRKRITRLELRYVFTLQTMYRSCGQPGVFAFLYSRGISSFWLDNRSPISLTLHKSVMHQFLTFYFFQMKHALVVRRSIRASQKKKVRHKHKLILKISKYHGRWPWLPLQTR